MRWKREVRSCRTTDRCISAARGRARAVWLPGRAAAHQPHEQPAWRHDGQLLRHAAAALGTPQEPRGGHALFAHHQPADRLPGPGPLGCWVEGEAELLRATRSWCLPRAWCAPMGCPARVPVASSRWGRPLRVKWRADSAQSSTEALQRLPQSRAQSISRRSRLVGRPSCRAAAGSGARRRSSWAFSRRAMLSAVSSYSCCAGRGTAHAAQCPHHHDALHGPLAQHHGIAGAHLA